MKIKIENRENRENKITKYLMRREERSREKKNFSNVAFFARQKFFQRCILPRQNFFDVPKMPRQKNLFLTWQF
jgi:hypothetical protein